jgi:hypothetical protein
MYLEKDGTCEKVGGGGGGAISLSERVVINRNAWNTIS